MPCSLNIALAISLFMCSLLGFIPLFAGCNPDIRGGCVAYDTKICQLDKKNVKTTYCYSSGKTGACDYNVTTLVECQKQHNSCHAIYDTSYQFTDCGVTIYADASDDTIHTEGQSYRLLSGGKFYNETYRGAWIAGVVIICVFSSIAIGFLALAVYDYKKNQLHV